MHVEGARSLVDDPGQYSIAKYIDENVENTVIVNRGVSGPQGIVTWGMSGCHGVAVFGGQSNNAAVDFLAMFHASGGLNSDRLIGFLDYVGKNTQQPGGEFEWVLVISQGNETEQYRSWTELSEYARESSSLNGIRPRNVYIMNGSTTAGQQAPRAIASKASTL